MPDDTTIKFDEKAFLSSLEKAEIYFKQFAGKANHNPFFNLRSIEILRDRFKKGERTSELFDLASTFKLEEPFVDKNLAPKVLTKDAPKIVIPTKVTELQAKVKEKLATIPAKTPPVK